jgi:TATA-box binding protein (TBP) (component of TFIID and TFIIIB)
LQLFVALRRRHRERRHGEAGAVEVEGAPGRGAGEAEARERQARVGAERQLVDAAARVGGGASGGAGEDLHERVGVAAAGVVGGGLPVQRAAARAPVVEADRHDGVAVAAAARLVAVDGAVRGGGVGGGEALGQQQLGEVGDGAVGGGAVAHAGGLEDAGGVGAGARHGLVERAGVVGAEDARLHVVGEGAGEGEAVGERLLDEAAERGARDQRLAAVAREEVLAAAGLPGLQRALEHEARRAAGGVCAQDLQVRGERARGVEPVEVAQEGALLGAALAPDAGRELAPGHGAARSDGGGGDGPRAGLGAGGGEQRERERAAHRGLFGRRRGRRRAERCGAARARAMARFETFAAAQHALELSPADEHEEPPVESLLSADGVLLPLPLLTNFVVVAQPQPSPRPVRLRLEQIAERRGFDINNRRFAAVKISLGRPQQRCAHAEPAGAAGACADFVARELARARSPRELAAPRAEQAVASALREPMATCLFFGSGNMVCTGASNPYTAMAAVHQTAALIREVNPEYRTPVCQIENIVASVQLLPAGAAAGAPRAKRRRRQPEAESGRLPLRELAQSFGLEANYQPELFPGAIFRPGVEASGAAQICFLVFPSGQCVVTGAKSTREVYRNFKAFYLRLCEALLQMGTDEARAAVPRALQRQYRRGGGALS